MSEDEEARVWVTGKFGPAGDWTLYHDGETLRVTQEAWEYAAAPFKGTISSENPAWFEALWAAQVALDSEKARTRAILAPLMGTAGKDVQEPSKQLEQVATREDSDLRARKDKAEWLFRNTSMKYWEIAREVAVSQRAINRWFAEKGLSWTLSIAGPIKLRRPACRSGNQADPVGFLRYRSAQTTAR